MRRQDHVLTDIFRLNRRPDDTVLTPGLYRWFHVCGTWRESITYKFFQASTTPTPSFVFAGSVDPQTPTNAVRSSHFTDWVPT